MLKSVALISKPDIFSLFHSTKQPEELVLIKSHYKKLKKKVSGRKKEEIVIYVPVLCALCSVMGYYGPTVLIVGR